MKILKKLKSCGLLLHGSYGYFAVGLQFHYRLTCHPENSRHLKRRVPKKNAFPRDDVHTYRQIFSFPQSRYRTPGPVRLPGI